MSELMQQEPIFLDDGRELHRVSVRSHHFEVTTAEADFNPEKKTLFATKLWEGAKVSER
jgi:hypothetical protein